MKKKLLKFQTLVMVIAVFLSFGPSTVQAVSKDHGQHTAQLILADQSITDSNSQDVYCNGHKNHCTFGKTQHSHANECYPIPSHLSHTDPVDPANMFGKMMTKNLVKALSAPPLRPPRFFA